MFQIFKRIKKLNNVYLKNPVIISSKKNIIKINASSGYDKFIPLKELNNKFRNYFQRLFQFLSVYFNTESLNIEYDIGPIMKEIPMDKWKATEYTFTGVSCYYCHLCEFNPWEVVKDRIAQTGSYGQCVMNMHIFNNDAHSKGKIALDKKFFEHFSNLKSIHLINCPAIFNDTKVKADTLLPIISLKLTKNEISMFPSIISEMKSLKSISIENNPIKSLAGLNNFFMNHHNLKNLSLTKLPVSIEDLKKEKTAFIKLPNALEKLNLNQLTLDFIPFNLEDCTSTLNSLSFQGVPWVSLEEIGGVNGFLSFEALVEKLGFLMPENEIKKLFIEYDTDGNNVLSNREIYRLNARIFKMFPRLNHFPTSILILKKLTHLDLSYQALTKISDEISDLECLSNLILDNCIFLEEISPKLSECPIAHISLENCESLKTPPLEIVGRGLKSIMSYLKRLSSGFEECNRTKLMLVGLGEAGKTSLVRALKSKYDDQEISLTDGISIEDWNIDLSNNSMLTFSIWDFGKPH